MAPKRKSYVGASDTGGAGSVDLAAAYKAVTRTMGKIRSSTNNGAALAVIDHLSLIKLPSEGTKLRKDGTEYGTMRDGADFIEAIIGKLGSGRDGLLRKKILTLKKQYGVFMNAVPLDGTSSRYEEWMSSAEGPNSAIAVSSNPEDIVGSSGYEAGV